MVDSFRLTFYNTQIGLNYSMSVHGQRVEQESSFARAAVTATEPNPCGRFYVSAPAQSGFVFVDVDLSQCNAGEYAMRIDMAAGLPEGHPLQCCKKTKCCLSNI